jgi:DNA replication protein DnaC
MQIQDYEQIYKDRKLYASRRERYRDQWTGSKMKVSNLPDPVELDFETAKKALWHQMKQSLFAKGKEFYLDMANKDTLNDIIKSVTGDMTGNINPGKGIYLYGRYSTGKTWIMKQIMQMMSYAYHSLMYIDLELPYMICYKSNIMMRARKEKDISFIADIFKGKKLIYIDDLGYEDDSELVLYGNRENMIVHLVEILHQEYLKGATIHFTSNLQISSPHDVPTILSKYGRGTHDRLMEMCTPVWWKGERNLRTEN